MTFKDRVDQLELLFGTLGLKEADSLIDAVLDGTTPVQTRSDGAPDKGVSIGTFGGDISALD